MRLAFFLLVAAMAQPAAAEDCRTHATITGTDTTCLDGTTARSHGTLFGRDATIRRPDGTTVTCRTYRTLAGETTTCR